MILLAFSYRVPADTEHMYGRNSRVVLREMIFSEKNSTSFLHQNETSFAQTSAIIRNK